ncbi:MAG TPA: DNA-formamidopyrimidine glycosylase family protein [Solirubrobacterales bacterium]|nr:DNA-formamidopyrimidine glycosylase family protein [Solirubrobacterales bacterium]
MAEGDTVLRTARRLERGLAGQRVEVTAPSPRGRSTGVERLDGLELREVTTRGKNLLLDFGEAVLHSHLGMNGAWHVYPRGGRWAKSMRSAWAVLRGESAEAVQFGGPTLRVLTPGQARRDLRLTRLGPDILAPRFSDEEAVASLRRAEPASAVGEALLDQSLIAGIGNIFKSEGCFAAGVDPRVPIGELTDARLTEVVTATRALMEEAVHSGRPPRRIYRRAGEPCPRCRARIRSRGQGDANRTAYWCPSCQS